MFVWSSLAHMATPLGTAGIRQLTNDQPVVSVLGQQAGTASGLFMYPSLGEGPNAMQEYSQKLATLPSGLLLYHPPGQGRVFSVQLLIVEFLTEVLQALIAAWLLAQTRLVGYGSRVLFVAMLGVVAAVTTNVPYWNWYGFPATYTTAYMFVQFAGFVVVGLVAAKVIRVEPSQVGSARAMTAMT
jgi:hypothetical protein